jgi:hypothetical protein
MKFATFDEDGKNIDIRVDSVDTVPLGAVAITDTQYDTIAMSDPSHYWKLINGVVTEVDQ